MGRQRGVVRTGYRRQPASPGPFAGGVQRRPQPRVAGRVRWRLPRLRPPTVRLPERLTVRLPDRWRPVAAGALAFAAFVAGAWWVYHSPLLSLNEVSVEGASLVSADLVRETAGLEGETIIRPDFAAARERLVALPMVRSARIERDWPNGARVVVVERQPWGVWQLAGQPFVVDDEGVVIDAPPPPGAPVIVQTDAAPPLAPGSRVDFGAVAVVRELTPTAQRTVGRPVATMEFSRASGLVVVLAGTADVPETRVTFGDVQAYEFKLAALYAVIRQAQDEGRDVRAVDLRFGQRVAVQSEARP